MRKFSPTDSRSTGRRLRALITNLAVVLVALLVSLGGAEALLRAYPSLIDIRFLTRFHEDLRTPIAVARGFATPKDRRLIKSEDRTDKGPPFVIYLPGRLYVHVVDQADIDVGAAQERQMDNTGFCNPLDNADRAAVDVVMLGDSFTVCMAIDAADTFTARIENQTGLTTYNLGVGGIGPYEYLELLRKFGLALKPKVVVMNVYEGNDPRDLIKNFDFRATGVLEEDKTRLGGPFAVSYALAYLKAGVELTLKQLKRKKIDFGYSVDAQGTRWQMNLGNSDIDEVRHARRVVSGELSFDLFAEPLSDFVALAAEHDFIPVVTRLPSAHTAYRESVRFDSDVGREVALYSEAQGDWLAENADRIGYRFFDTVPTFREQVKSRPLAFYPSNVHFTSEGHAIVAEMLGPELQKIVGARQ